MFLSVGSNHFSGSLPTSWQLPNTLTGLFLENNTLSGTIPAAFWASLPASLIDINLSTNRLTGTLSADWAIPRSMMTIVLTNNSLHGGATLGSLRAEHAAPCMPTPSNYGEVASRLASI